MPVERMGKGGRFVRRPQRKIPPPSRGRSRIAVHAVFSRSIRGPSFVIPSPEMEEARRAAMDLRTVVRSEFTKPKERFRKIDGEESKLWKEPQPKRFQSNETRPNLKAAHDDEELRAVLREAGVQTTVVDFGASWCDHCKGMLPWFAESSDKVSIREKLQSMPRGQGRAPSGTDNLVSLTQFPNMTFVMADVDRMPEMARDIRYTPTFSFYVNGKKVDEVFGSNRRQIGDRMWLHAS